MKALLLLIITLFISFSNCSVFSKSVKITTSEFDYRSISQNYFSPANERPFPLTIQRGNNLYGSTTRDGNYLFYTTDNAGNYDIWFRDLKSSLIVPVTSHPAAEYKPAISPDGKKILYVSEEFDSFGDIVYAEIDPKDWIKEYTKGNKPEAEKILVTGSTEKKDSFSDTDPVWAPDSKRFAFSSERLSIGTQNILLGDISKPGKFIPVTKEGGISPSFSADGNFICYISYKNNQWGDVYILNLITMEEKRLSDDFYPDFSPSFSSKEPYIYYTSIRKDSNKNSKLDERDKSIIIRINYLTGEESPITSDTISLFDTRYSEFNGGSIIYSAALYNTINIYYIPAQGVIPKQDSIKKQFDLAVQYREKQSMESFFLALDAITLYFDKDPLYPLFYGRILESKAYSYSKINKKAEAAEILRTMRSFKENKDFAFAYALSIRIKSSETKTNPVPELTKFYTEVKTQTSEETNASILNLIGEESEKFSDLNLAKKSYSDILQGFPNYFRVHEVKRKLTKLEFSENQEKIPDKYFELLNDSKLEKEDKRILLEDMETIISKNKNYLQKISYSDKILSEANLKTKSKPVFELLSYIKASSLYEGKKFQESIALLDSYLDPIPPEPPTCQVDPFCKKIPLCVNDSVCLKSHLLKFKNLESQGKLSLSFNEIRVYLENYDPELGVEMDKSDMEKTFRFYENKAREHESNGNLRDASIHYFYNTENMYLLKYKNLFVNTLYQDYAIYFQRKMVDSVLNLAKKQAEEDKQSLLDEINVLGKNKLNVLGRAASLFEGLTDNRITGNLKVLGDIKDLQGDIVLGRPGKPDNALRLIDEHFNLSRPRARPVLYLASLYGYSYYLINRAVIYEEHYKSNGIMTPTRKSKILQDLKNAENELKWIIFADPQYADAYQLLGWLYQYIDIYKSTRADEEELTDGEIYASEYEKFFPKKNFEENIDLYKQILDFLGDIPNKKILSDLNLNLANNYLLLNNFPNAKEHYSQVEKYSSEIIEQVQFEDFKQTAIFYYNYARTLIFLKEYEKAIYYLEKAADVYYKNQYYTDLTNTKSGKKGTNTGRVNKKLALIHAMIGLAQMERNNYIEAIKSYNKALSLNYDSNYIDSINLYNALAICYQKTEKYHLSEYYIKKVRKEYKNYKKSKKFQIPDVRVAFWNTFMPDKVRVIGDGRFPNAFSPEYHYLLSLSIRISNAEEQGDFEGAEKYIKERDEFMKDTGIESTITGQSITNNSRYKLANNQYAIDNFEEAYNLYNEIAKKLDTSPSQSAKTKKEERKILKNKSIILFEWFQAGKDKEKLFSLLLENINGLNKEKNDFLSSCTGTNPPPDADSEKYDKCLKKFHGDWPGFDPLLGLNYYYLGELYRDKKDRENAFYYYGLALNLIKNPANIPSYIIGLQEDIYTRHERLKLKINETSILEKIGDTVRMNESQKEAEDTAKELQSSGDIFYLQLIKARTLFQQAKKTSDYKSINQFLTEAEKNLFQSYAVFMSQYKYFIHELYKMKMHCHFKTGEMKEILLLEEKLHALLVFKQLLGSRIKFEDENLQIKYLALRRLISKDFEIKDKIKQTANTSKPISGLLEERSKLKEEIEESLDTIRDDHPGKQVLFGSALLLKPDSIPFNEAVIKVNKFGKEILVTILSGSSEAFKVIPEDKEELKNYLSSQKSNLSAKNKLIFIPDEDLIHLNPVELLENIVSKNTKIDYALKVSQYINPFRDKDIVTKNVTILTPNKKEDPYFKDGRFFEFKNLKYLDHLAFDSDVLDTSISYDRSNVFISRKKGHLAPSDLAAVSSSLSSVILRNPSFDGENYLSTIAAVDLIQSSGTPLVIFAKGEGGDNLDSIFIEENSKDFQRISYPNSTIQVKTESSGPEENIKKGLKEERVENYKKAIQYYNYANMQVLTGNIPDTLPIEILQARAKTKLYTKVPGFTFYLRLLKKYEKLSWAELEIYESLLHYCYVYEEKNKCTLFFKNYYSLLKKADYISSEDRKKKISTINFYVQFARGIKKDRELLLANYLNSSKIDDPFIFYKDLSIFLIKYYYPEKALDFAKKMKQEAETKDEKIIADSWINDINVQSAFYGDSNSREFLDNNLYTLGLKKDWVGFQDKIAKKKYLIYDDQLINFRKKLFTLWKKQEFGEEYSPEELAPETTVTGKPIYSYLNDTELSLIFYLLLNSLRLQNKDEVNKTFLIYTGYLQANNREERAIHAYTSWIEELVHIGDYSAAITFLKEFAGTFKENKLSDAIIRRLAISKYKLGLYAEFKESLKIKLPKINEIEDYWMDKYSEAGKSDTNNFHELINKTISERKVFSFSYIEKRNFLDFLHYLQFLSMNNGDSETFTDIGFYKDSITPLEKRIYISDMKFDDLPEIKRISKNLLLKLPKDQYFLAVLNFGLSTYSIKFQNSDSNGEVAFKDYREFREGVYEYHRQVRKKGKGLLLKEFLEPKFRKAIELEKKKTGYLYLSGFFLKAPLELKEEDNFYLVFNPETLTERTPVKYSSFTVNQFKIMKHNSSNFSSIAYKKFHELTDLEIKETGPDSSRFHLSVEDLRLNEKGTLEFSKLPIQEINKLQERSGAWLLSYQSIYPEYFLRDDINLAVSYLDKIHRGPGIISFSGADNLAMLEFIKSVTSRNDLNTGIKDRYIEAVKTIRAKYTSEANWNGLRLCTNVFITE